MSKRTVFAETIRAERANCNEINTFKRLTTFYRTDTIAAAKADTRIAVGSLYFTTGDTPSSRNYILRRKEEQT